MLSEEQVRGLSVDQLLDALVEECSEIIHASIKGKRYGLRDRWEPRGPRTNAEDVCLEFRQLEDLVAEVRRRGGVDAESIEEEYQRSRGRHPYALELKLE